MPKAKYWCFTYNNPTPDDVIQLGAGILYITWQVERGAQGTPHYQGYFECAGSHKLSEAKDLLGLGRKAHLQPSRSEAAIAYCHKEDTRLDGPWELGRKPKPIRRGERTELTAIGERIKGGESLESIARSDPGTFIKFHRGLGALESVLVSQRDWKQPCTITVYLGDSRTGKSTSVAERYANCAVYSKDGNTKWWDGYRGERVVWIDEWVGCEGIPPSVFLQICDKFPLRVETKGGSVQLSATEVVLTTTVHWAHWYKGTRWFELWSTSKVVDFQARLDEFGEVIRTIRREES